MAKPQGKKSQPAKSSNKPTDTSVKPATLVPTVPASPPTPPPVAVLPPATSAVVPTPPPPSSTTPKFTDEFHVVLNHELDQVAARRTAVLGESTPVSPCAACCTKDHLSEEETNKCVTCVRDRAKRMDLFGVSFSGGGIRSATFSLGILQALGKLKLLRHVDYLSTVSGGGYIGGWLAAWIRRETDGLKEDPLKSAVDQTKLGEVAVENVERQLDPDRTNQARSHRLTSGEPPTARGHFAEDREPSPIHHLRAHSRYLSPRTGLFSLDTWSVFAIYVRNLFVNALIVVPLLALIVLAVRLTVRGYSSGRPGPEWWSQLAFGGFCLCLVVARIVIERGLAEVRRNTDVESSPTGFWRSVAFAVAVCLGVWALAPAHPGVPARNAFGAAAGGWMFSPAIPCVIDGDGLPAAIGGWVYVSTPAAPLPPTVLADSPSRLPTELRFAANTELRFPANETDEGEGLFGNPSDEFPLIGNSYFLGALLFVYLSFISILFSIFTWLLYQLPQKAGWWVRNRGKIVGVVLLAVAVAVYYFGGLTTMLPLTAVGTIVGLVLLLLALPVVLLYSRTASVLTVHVVRAFTLLLYGVSVGLLVMIVVNEFLYMGTSRPALFATLGPPLFLLAIWLAGIVEVAVAGGWFSDYEREWRSRIVAWLLLIAVGWAAVFGIVVYLPQLLDNRGGTATTGGVVLLTAALRFLVPRLAKSPGLMTWAVVKIVPVVFLVALLALVASGVDRLVHQFPPENVAELVEAKWRRSRAAEPTAHEIRSDLVPNENPTVDPTKVSTVVWQHHSGDGMLTYADWLEVSTGLAFAVVAGIAVVLFVVFVLVVPVNRFSLHSMYANRLIRGYLGAARRPAKAHLDLRSCVPTAAKVPRKANTFSGFDPNDDLPLVRLRADIGTSDLTQKTSATVSEYFGPLPLFNATLNMVTGGELAYQDRRGDSFTLTPYFCGSFATGYAKLNGGDGKLDHGKLQDQIGRYWNLTVGRAVTISGAAIDPNMVIYYSEQFTAFLTIMNARLGWWMENPKEHEGKATIWNATPPVGSWHYIQELLGQTEATRKNVHLSDGGHFENTGTYELIRRRCRFILLVDAADNPDHTSENLANLVRLVRADFGIRIDIDTTPLKKGADGRTSDWHCAVGQIRYDDVDAGGVIGTLLFVRSSLTGDEQPDIKNYAVANPEFPHHGTANQFFDEAQFESYRGLGYHIGMSVLAEAAESTRAHPTGGRFLRRLFGKLRRRWTPCSTVQREQYIQSCVESLREGGDDQQDGDTVRQIQLMELAWLRNDLSNNYSHPIQRGWVNIMREWSADEEFQRVWRRVRSEFSQDFVRFCERALNVNQPSLLLTPHGLHHPDDWADLQREFGQEFLSYLAKELPPVPPSRAGDYLDKVAKLAGANCWLIGCGDPDERNAIVPVVDAAKLKHVIGFAAVFKPVIGSKNPTDRLGNPVAELLIWIRGPFRMAGLGAVAMRELIQQKKIGGKGALFARFPRVGSGPAEQLQRAMWVQFMNDFDFYGVPPTGAAWEERELRVQYLP